MYKNRAFSFIVLLLAVLSLVSGCSDSSGSGKLNFTLLNDGTPSTPNIAIPSACTKVELSLFQTEEMKEQESGGNLETSEADEDSASPSPSPSLSESSLKGKDDGNDSASATDESSDSSSSESSSAADSEEDNTGSDEPTLYASTDYTEGDEVKLSLSKVPAGSWVLRVNALDGSGSILGHVQQTIDINSGQSVKVKEWLLPGSAPSGYIFVSHPTSGSISRVCLESGSVENVELAGFTPAKLFAKNSLTGKTGESFYCSTGGNSLLRLSPSYSKAVCEVEDIGFVKNAEDAVGGAYALLSFYLEGGVRFFDYETKDYSNLTVTGAQAGAISNIVNDYAYVANASPMTLSKVRISEKRVEGDNIYLGYAADSLCQTDDGSRIWTCGGAKTSSAPFIRVISNTGKEIRHYTKLLGSPGCVLLVDDIACISDVGRKEIIFFADDGGKDSEELERVSLSGGGETMISDGERLYILINGSNKIDVVDLQTFAYIQSYKVSSGGLSLLWVKR